MGGLARELLRAGTDHPARRPGLRRLARIADSDEIADVAAAQLPGPISGGILVELRGERGFVAVEATNSLAVIE